MWYILETIHLALYRLAILIFSPRIISRLSPLHPNLSFRDDWPTDFDGQNLLTLTRTGRSPFQGIWDVNLLIREIEENLDTEVIDIPFVYNGSNNYGFHIKLSTLPDIIARLSHSDVNMPNYDGFPARKQIPKANFEAAVYELLRLEPTIPVSRLLYYRIPIQHRGPRLRNPQDISGRQLFVFEKTDGENNVWKALNPKQKAVLLAQAARIRASLFKFDLPHSFASTWLLISFFSPGLTSLPLPISPTRTFCTALLESKILSTIREIGAPISWPSDHQTVGPVAFAAKQSLLRLIHSPGFLPEARDEGKESAYYRLVLEHGDFGIHNMSITLHPFNNPRITAIYDWETGHVIPALLSDPLMAVTANLVVDENAELAIARVDDDEEEIARERYMGWSKQYFGELQPLAPEHKRAIRAGKEARFLWFALRDWRGEDPVGYFGGLGKWAERRMEELGAEWVDEV